MGSPGQNPVETVIRTFPDGRTSLVGKLASIGVQEGATLPSTAAEITSFSGIVGKVSGVLTAVGLGIEGGFAISCR